MIPQAAGRLCVVRPRKRAPPTIATSFPITPALLPQYLVLVRVCRHRHFHISPGPGNDPAFRRLGAASSSAVGRVAVAKNIDAFLRSICRATKVVVFPRTAAGRSDYQHPKGFPRRKSGRSLVPFTAPTSSSSPRSPTLGCDLGPWPPARRGGPPIRRPASGSTHSPSAGAGRSRRIAT